MCSNLCYVWPPPLFFLFFLFFWVSVTGCGLVFSPPILSSRLFLLCVILLESSLYMYCLYMSSKKFRISQALSWIWLLAVGTKCQASMCFLKKPFYINGNILMLLLSSIICVCRATMIGSIDFGASFRIAVAGTSARPRTFKKVFFFSFSQLLVLYFITSLPMYI